MSYNHLLNVELFPFQEKGVQYALSHHYCIIADDMGLGKTVQAITVGLHTGLKTLVVVPAYLRSNWEAEYEKFAAKKQRVFVAHKASQIKGIDFTKYDVVIISYSQVSKAVKCFAWAEYVIADEVHYLKNCKADRTLVFHDFLEAGRPKRFIGLSGTPIKNRVQEYYSLLCLCSYNIHETSGKDIFKAFPNFYKFCQTFCYADTVYAHGRKIKKFTGLKNVELLKTFLKGKLIRRTGDKVLDLPELIIKDVIVSHKKDKELEDAWDAFENGIKGVHTSTAKAKSALAKTNFTCKYVNDLLEQGEGPIVIFTDHLNSAQMLSEFFIKLRCSTITGATSMEKRHLIIKDLQAGKLDILVATIGAASTGSNMTAARHIVLNDPSWVNANNAQAYKRIHRIGQKGRCMIHRILGSSTDLMILKTLEEKEKNLRRLL